MAAKTNCILVLSTCPGSTVAKKIAQTLVNEKLAACVNVVPGLHSFFAWAGKVDTAKEHLLIIKTTRDNYEAIEERIRILHPYELPEIIAVPIETGLGDYLDWIEANTEQS